jgi:hypothetical protein
VEIHDVHGWRRRGSGWMDIGDGLRASFWHKLAGKFPAMVALFAVVRGILEEEQISGRSIVA